MILLRISIVSLSQWKNCMLTITSKYSEQVANSRILFHHCGKQVNQGLPKNKKYNPRRCNREPVLPEGQRLFLDAETDSWEKGRNWIYQPCNSNNPFPPTNRMKQWVFLSLNIEVELPSMEEGQSEPAGEWVQQQVCPLNPNPLRAITTSCDLETLFLLMPLTLAFTFFAMVSLC